MANKFRINKRGIEQLTRELQREFNRHPIDIPVQHGTSRSLPPEGSLLPYNLDLDEDEIRTLDHVADMEDRAATADIGTIRGLLGEKAAAVVLESLTGDNYLRRSPHAYPRYSLTQTGKKAIRAHRRFQSREDLLQWLDSFPDGKRPSTAQLPGNVDLAPYTEQEIRAAAQFLIQYHLAATFAPGSQPWGGEFVIAWITELGRECVEAPGTINDFLSRRNQPMGNTQHFNIGGSNNTVVGTSGDSNQVTVAVDNFDLEAVRTTTAAIRQSRDVLNLPEAADALIDTIEHSEDRGVVHRAGRELYLLVAATGTGALGSVLAGPLGHALGIGS